METLQSKELRQMIESAANHLQNNKKLINDLNIFPVPDGDTGTNMGMTFGAAAQETLGSLEDTKAGELLNVLARSSLRNARGNSGVILSQILRGLANAVASCETIGVKEIVAAAKMSRDTAYRAVMKPTEGTILTVVREIAEFAENNIENYTEADNLLKDMLKAGKESLDRTPEILPVLKQAGVVDAGGMGVYTILEGAVFALEGNPVKLLDSANAAVVKKKETVTSDDIKYLYCTEFLINKNGDKKATPFKAAIGPKGDCMLVIEDEEIVKVHIHTNHPGFVIEEALKLGELTSLKIDNMKYQHEENHQEEQSAEPRKKYGVVSVSAGEGLEEVLKSVGVDAIVQGGQTMNPSTQDLLDAVQSVSAETVFIFPNNKNIILSAEQVCELADVNVKVIPTKNIPQGISAMLAFNEDASLEENVEAMTEMMGMVKCGQITFAARNSTVDGRKIKKNDVMGMIGSTISCVGKDLNAVAEELVHSMIDDESGVITLYYGADVKKEYAEKLEKILAEKYEYLDVSLVYGGQPVYYYFIAVE